MQGDDADVHVITSVLSDERARRILAETHAEARSATELSDCCGVSEQTVYRRLDTLSECGLVTERVEMEPDGHHYHVYRSTFDRVLIEFSDGEFEATVARRGRMADRFTEFVNEVREE
ncbi:ArsR/SmtB family transcription factor [Halorubrum tibetense]|uniref:ArsR/SmtB family transcription factor n=1 Tax=Halorubrum tibetense TaxID=175631 RepID=A0ABD5S8J4_9EURY